ncbi:FMN-binding glutamate synthase family protein [Crocinitomix catalasitica]|uniref:FMN-binding glutamate synthase family protein n=1 Tax=Crocinitomix catalasitica TaxID=184607 RepID=UPI000687E571|nr:FMN-binding glutamate synthase family protein [Crocinitomix catalasitica]
MVRTIFFVTAFIITAAICLAGIYINPNYFLWFILFAPLIVIGTWDAFQTKHAIRKNFPVIGNLRYILESISPEIQQYFVERRTDGAPINKNKRAIIYERSKNLGATHPFGTEENVYSEGYEFITQSLYPAPLLELEPRVMIGGADCKKPYSASIYNISAMSFGSLSKNAVMALNKGANMGGFYQNTGEGGIAPYHLQGGDLVWQVGTGYFGCRNEDGSFSAERFTENATRPEVKMIELKLSQGAKPGHGGVLPGVKNTEEIGRIRGVKPGITVLSPAGHSAFDGPMGLIKFISELRELSGGKPVGFKLCIGKAEEFEDICKAMATTEIYPDFISIDGSEGGTGAAPLEFANFVGMPLYVGLVIANKLLIKHGIRQKVKIIASGKVFNGFGILKAMAMGADLTQSARSMMLSIGCIHAQLCNTNTCPVGVATQDKRLMKGLNVNDKYVRAFNYHKNTVHAFLELLSATGSKHPNDLSTENIMRMTEDGDSQTMTEVIENWTYYQKYIGKSLEARPVSKS